MGFIKSSLLIQDDNCLYLQGEEEPGPEAEERGGYLPIPRRDERAGNG
jgi:hypothetical protein